MKKFKLTDDKIKYLGRTLYRIQALQDFGDVKAGDLGGFVEKEENLSHTGNCWIYDEAKVFGNACVCDDARVFGNAWVFGDAQIYGNAWVFDNTQVHGDARVFDNARVYGNVFVFGDAQVHGDAYVYGYARVYNDADIYSNKDYCVFQGFGSENRTTTFYREKDSGIGVVSGCFSGTIEEFEKQAEETHGDNKFGQEYKAIIEIVKIKFEIKNKQ